MPTIAQTGGQQQQPSQRQLRVAITGAANNGGGLIRITTAAPHRFQTGNTIVVSGVGGTTEANATRVITVITATTFDQVGSTFTNVYTSGGVASKPAQ